MERPRMAVTSADEFWRGMEAEEKVVWVEEEGALAINVPRRRNIAEGLSLDNLWGGIGVSAVWVLMEGGEDVHAQELEALSWPIKVHGCAVAIGEGDYRKCLNNNIGVIDRG